jgi:hypothetical protein
MQTKKGPAEASPLYSVVPWEHHLHDVLNKESTVVNVGVWCDCTKTCVAALCEWIRNHAVTGLETNLWLEAVWILRLELL